MFVSQHSLHCQLIVPIRCNTFLLSQLTILLLVLDQQYLFPKSEENHQLIERFINQVIFVVRLIIDKHVVELVT